jgi:hypothetical protein
MSYSLESKLNKWIKVLNMVIIFGFSIIMTYALFNRKDSKQQELGYLTIFIIVTLLILNLIVTLNPIQREDGIDLHQRSCCSSQNLMATLSFLSCFGILELHYSFAATNEQKEVFYKSFHQILGIWLLGLWIGIQKLPEVFFPNTKFIHKFMSSDIIKSSIVIFALLTVHYLIRDAMMLNEHPVLHTAQLAPAQTLHHS